MQALSYILFTLLFALRVEGAPVVPPGAHAVASRPAPAVILFAQASAAESAVVEDVFLGQPVIMRPEAQYVKVALVFAQPVKIHQVKVEMCEEELKDGVEFLFSPSGTRQYAEGGQKAAAAQLGKTGESVRSVTLNFGHNEKVCLKSLRFLAENERLIETRFPVPIASTVTGFTGSEVLFDSRPETSVRMAADGTPVTIAFDSPQTIDRIQIWNGDQASSSTFSENSGLSKLSLKDEGDYSQTFTLSRASGMQELKLSKPFTGQKLSVKGLSPGRISEIRFAGAKGVLFPRDLRIAESAKKRRASFEALELGRALDRQLRAGEGKDDWLFHFRSDGSFFAYGLTDDIKASRRFSVFGTFEVGSVIKNKIHLTLVGLRRTTAFPWDASTCGIACGEREDGRAVAVKDLITLEKIGSGEIMLRNSSPAIKRALPFSDLRARPTTLQE